MDSENKSSNNLLLFIPDLNIDGYCSAGKLVRPVKEYNNVQVRLQEDSVIIYLLYEVLSYLIGYLKQYKCCVLETIRFGLVLLSFLVIVWKMLLCATL